ncbi:Pkinase-domain-containing protein [Agrocybe pediades]|nr:Pkinase-domain-containing protein [Agrocybe pediades]
MQQATSSNATGGSPVELLDCCSRVQQQRSVTSIDLSFWGSIKGLFSAPESSVNLYLSRANLSCTVGADPTVSTILLPGSGISPCHCTISWDGDNANSVRLQNNSTDDSLTINGDPAARGKPYSLRDGDMICFPNSDGAFNASAVGKVGDYIFLYRHHFTAPPAFDDEYFEDKKDLASGAQGKVRKIVKRATDKLYAMKTIKTSGRPGIHSMKMYRAAQEIDIMKRMQHPAICQVYECFINPYSITVVMDYMNGGDLSKYLLKEGILDEPRAKDISFQIFGALAYIHSRGIVHADVKPQNIVLTRDAPPTVKLCDFGLSGAVCSHQRIQQCRGTEPYMAPEVLDTVLYQGFNVKADCWSMGVTMFSMLSGKSIYGGLLDVYDANRAISWSILDSISLNEQAKVLLRSLLDPNPYRRISSLDASAHAWFAPEAGPQKNQSAKKLLKGRRKTPSCHRCGGKYLQMKEAVKEAAEKVHKKKKSKAVIQ